jgi:hypothetical protein
MVPVLKDYLTRLETQRFRDWEKEDQKKFNISFAAVRDRVVADKHYVIATFSTMYGEILKPFAGGEAVEGPPVVLLMDEQSLTSEIRIILACMAPKFWKRITGVVLLGDH